MFHPLYWEVVVVRPGKLVSLRVLFLREQVRDLRVQEFLRELVVNVATPSNLARLFIIEILHSGEGGDVEQECSNLETILPCLRLLISLSTYLCFISCMLILFISVYA